MQIYSDLSHLRLTRPTALTIGNFDGVHRGHQALLSELQQIAAQGGMESAILTFDPHPLAVLRPTQPLLLLTTPLERLHLTAAMGIDLGMIQTFTREVAALEPVEFMGGLVQRLNVRALVVGPDFALGRNRSGNLDVLTTLGTTLGYAIHVIEPVAWDEQPVRSSAIRTLLSQGDVVEAAAMLGRPYHATGLVIHGDQRGRQIGIPTANLQIPDNKLWPADGVYATRTYLHDRPLNGGNPGAPNLFNSVTNLGVRPTVGGTEHRFESHLLDFPEPGGSDDLYGQHVTVEFIARLRGEQRFNSFPELVAQIHADIAQARRHVAAAGLSGATVLPPERLISLPSNHTMRILCISAQLPGHLDWGGYLGTAAELVRRGHHVLWASGIAVAEQVHRAQVPFHGLLETGWRWPPPAALAPEDNADPQSILHQRQLRALDQWLEVARVASATEEIYTVAAEFQPELILSEMFIAASGLVAEAVNTPLVVMGWPAPLPQATTGADLMAMVARQRLNELLARFQLTGVNWTSYGPPALCSPLLHLTYWSPSWFEGMNMAAQTVHVGGLRPPPSRDGQERTLREPELPSPEDAPWVLITLGTSFNVDPNFFIAAAHAADQLGCLPLLALGAPLESPWVQSMLPRLPASAILRPHLDFAAFLPHVSAAIHHGGAGTTHALVTHAVPQIVVPHAADQMRQAQGIMRSRVGHYLPPKEVTIPRLVEMLAGVLPDRSPLRAQAIALQTEFQALGGIPAAADRIVNFHYPPADW